MNFGPDQTGRTTRTLTELRAWSAAVIGCIMSGKCTAKEIADECQTLIDKRVLRSTGPTYTQVMSHLVRLRGRNRVQSVAGKWVAL